MTDLLHSSLLQRGQPIEKCPGGLTRAQDRASKLARIEANWRNVCRLVDRRDRLRCRVCGRACSPTALAMLDRAERHHLTFRSQGGSDVTSNVLTICKAVCHPAIHTLGVLRLVGDADQRDDRGDLNGVRVERNIADVWTVTEWV